MKVLVTWVRQELPTALSSVAGETVKQLDSFAQLCIEKEPSEGGGHGHKEIWNPENCKIALETTGMYEAGGNMCWLDPCLSDSTQSEVPTLPLEEPGWETVTSLATQFFSREVDMSSDPMLFPFLLEAYLTVGVVFGATHMSRAVLKILGSQVIVFAW